MMAAATAPGATTLTLRCRAVAIRKPRMKIAALTATDSTVRPIVRPAPRLAPNAAALLPSADRMVVPSTASPTVASSSRLTPRALIGLGPVSYTHLRAHETDSYLVCRLLL